MKKILRNLFAGVALLSATTSNAQLADGSTAPNFTLTDIFGTTHDLYTYLNAGKTVFIDFSAAWCGPCWAYHNSGALEELYAAHGPSGTCSQDVIVIFIEGESTNTTAQLYGPAGGSTYADATQGDWVTGTPYPIIDAGSASVVSDYAIGYFPTIYKICTDKKVYEVGQANAATLESSVTSCGFALDANISAGPTSLQCAGTFAPSFTFKNSGTTAITGATFSYSYDGGAASTQTFSGSLAAGATTTVSLPSSTFTVGAHTLDVEIVDANGGADGNKVNNCHSYEFNVNTGTAATAPLAEPFVSATFPYTDWILDNPDGGITWARTATSGGILKYDAFNYASAGESDEFYVKPVDISGVTSPILSFDVAYKPYSATYYEKLEVFVSDDCGATWSNIYNKSGATLQTVAAGTSAFTPTSTQWRTEILPLPGTVTGATRLYVKFKATNGYGNNLYVDNINIMQATAVNEPLAASFSVNVYPNPVNDLATVNVNLTEATDVQLSVTNAVGQVLYSQKVNSTVAGLNKLNLDFSAFSNGLYFVNVTANNQVVTTKITK